MHPDAFTPDSHRYRGADSDRAADHQAPPDAAPDADRHDDGAGTTSQNVATPAPEGGRTAEEGHAYTGRQMDDDLKANPRETGDDTDGGA